MVELVRSMPERIKAAYCLWHINIPALDLQCNVVLIIPNFIQFEIS